MRMKEHITWKYLLHESNKLIRIIKIENKTIYYSNYIKAGILLINHLQFHYNNVDSYNCALDLSQTKSHP